LKLLIQAEDSEFPQLELAEYSGRRHADQRQAQQRGFLEPANVWVASSLGQFARFCEHCDCGQIPELEDC
jgi:hypothetical protein